MWSLSIIGIGAEKSATTWAWTMLDAHPDVCMAQPKELNFFNLDENYSRGSSWYQRHFSTPASTCGEISPLYMDDVRVAGRIQQAYPDVRILVMLRDPFDRAISHLFHDASVHYGIVADLTIDHLKTLAAQDPKYIRRSCYSQALAAYFRHFDKQQIGTFFFDDVKQDGLNLAQRIYRFANVDDLFVPEQFSKKVNESQDLRSIAGTVIGLSKAARRLPVARPMMEWVYRNTRLRERAISWLMVDKGRPTIGFDDVFEAEDRQTLLNDMNHLRQLVGDLPAGWSTPEITAAA